MGWQVWDPVEYKGRSRNPLHGSTTTHHQVCTSWALPPYSLSWSGGFTPCGIWAHLQGENIQSYNLFSPVMMITWWMKLGGNRPLGDNSLVFLISGTGSIFAQSHRHGWTYQDHWLPSHGALGGKPKCSVPREGLRQGIGSQSNALNHWASPPPPPGIFLWHAALGIQHFSHKL